jgi:hypothetical protein
LDEVPCSANFPTPLHLQPNPNKFSYQIFIAFFSILEGYFQESCVFSWAQPVLEPKARKVSGTSIRFAHELKMTFIARHRNILALYYGLLL